MSPVGIHQVNMVMIVPRVVSDAHGRMILGIRHQQGIGVVGEHYIHNGTYVTVRAKHSGWVFEPFRERSGHFLRDPQI